VASLVFSVANLNASETILDLTSKKDFASKRVQQDVIEAQNEIIIVFKDGAKIPSTFYNIIKNFTYQQFNLANAMWIKSSSMSTSEMISFFQNLPFSNIIANITPNYGYKIKTNDSYYSKLWAVENVGQEVNGQKGTKDADMDIKEAWNLEKGSSDTIVAVLDTGVDYTHEDLLDNMWRGNAKHGYDFAGDDNGNNDSDPMPDEPYDENGHYHGTHVAGIIGAVGDNGLGVSGVNQNVQIMALKVFRPNGYGYTSDILEALDFVGKKVDEGVNIVAINASYGGGGGSQDDAVNSAIKELGKKGVVFCAAAGNEGKNIDNDPVYPASYNASNIVAVAASDQDDNLASFSNYGKNTVDVAAPGTNILSTYPQNQYAYLQGTSMATPYVTGLVALVSSYNPELSVEEKIEILKNSVDKKSSLSSKVASQGRVNANSALELSSSDNGNGGGDNNSGGGDNGNDGDNGDNQKPNNPPSAKDDSATTDYETKVTIDVLANDSDIDGDSLSIKSVSNPKHGKVKIRNNKVEYTPDSGFSGNDSFTYTVTDGKDSASATVYVKVNEKPNNPPSAKDDSATTDYETKVTIDVLANDSDIDGDSLTIKGVSNPKHGKVKIRNNKVEYTPDNGFSGNDSFTYTVTDGKDSDLATVYVKVKEEEKEDSSGGWFFGGFFGSSHSSSHSTTKKWWFW